MKDVIEFLKQRRNVKYSLGMIVFGLIFALSFQASRAQVFQILEDPIKIIPGTKEARQYQISGWQGVWAKGKKSILKVAFPRKKSYQMVIKAFSCSPPDARDQRIEVHFNNVALARLKFRKTTKWQKFSVNIPLYLLQETNTIKFVYTQDIHISPVAFDSLEFKNYIFRIKDLYLLLDSHRGKADYLTSRTVGYSFGFAFLLWFFWLFYSRFLFRLIPACRRGRGGPADASPASTVEVEEAGPKMKFSRVIRIDFLSYLPSVILLSLLALISFFSSYQFVYSLKTFFVLAFAPTAVLKLFPYKDLSPRFIIELLQPVFKFLLRIPLLQPVFRFILRDIEKTYLDIKKACFIIKIKIIKPIIRYILYDIEKTCSEIKRAYSACLFFFSFLKKQIITFTKFFIRRHKTNLSSAFILDFIILLILCAFLLKMKESVPTWIVDRIASLAYLLLVIGVVMKAISLLRENRRKG